MSIQRASSCSMIFVLSLFAGCSSSPSTSTTGTGSNSPAISPAAYIFSPYYINNGNSTYSSGIASYSLGANGTGVSPSSQVGPSTNPSYSGVHGDGNGHVYATSVDKSGVLTVYEYSDSAGVLAVVRSFTTTLPIGYGYEFGVDSAGEVFISYSSPTNNLLVEFSGSATGVATPIHSLTLPQSLTAIKVDANGNVYGYFVNQATGSFSPNIVEIASGLASATPANTTNTASYVTSVYDFALDTKGNIFVIGVDSKLTLTLWEFAGGTSSAAPIRTITSSHFVVPNAVAADAAGYVYVEDVGAALPAFLGFAPTQSGAVTPAISFTGALAAAGGTGTRITVF